MSINRNKIAFCVVIRSIPVGQQKSRPNMDGSFISIVSEKIYSAFTSSVVGSAD
jgi:hypothetical protein